MCINTLLLFIKMILIFHNQFIRYMISITKNYENTGIQGLVFIIWKAFAVYTANSALCYKNFYILLTSGISFSLLLSSSNKDRPWKRASSGYTQSTICFQCDWQMVKHLKYFLKWDVVYHFILCIGRLVAWVYDSVGEKRKIISWSKQWQQ